MNDRKHLVGMSLVTVAIIGLVHFLVPGGWGWIFTPFRQAFAEGGGWADSLVAVPVWLLGVFWGLILTALGALVIVRLNRRQKIEVEVPTITKAEIFGLHWRWNFREGEVCDVKSYCPKCSREVKARSEKRHGFLNLISFACECRKWRSKSFHCSQAEMMERVCRAIEEKTKVQPAAAGRKRCAAG